MGKFHFLEVGCGDATIIHSPKSGTLLVDCHDIERHQHLLPPSKILQGVFITHQHRDHYSGLEYLKKHGYKIAYLIYSPYQRRHGDNSVTIEEWQEFASFKDHFVAQGTKIRMPCRQDNFDQPWWNLGDLRFWVIGPNKDIATSETRELHDACLVVTAIGTNQSTQSCVFTGDASDTNLNWVANHTKNYCNGILHASHHGSINGADLDFIKGANAVHTIVSTASGVHSSVPDQTAMKRYRDYTQKKVYRTDQDGTLTASF